VTAPLKVFLVAGESSGDQLGAHLMGALRRALGDGVGFTGVGGPAMTAAGLASLFPSSDIAVIGPRAVLARLPLIWRRLREAVEAVARERPDILVVIDSPEFTQRLARRARKRLPGLTIVKYVAPQIWAWRPGRGRRMRPYIDHVLALLPFEPAAYERLGGPPTSYVGHPLVEAAAAYRPDAAERAMREARDPARLVVLLGSRSSEVMRLAAPFGGALAELARRGHALEVAAPVVPHLAAMVETATASWPVKPRLVEGEAGKLAAFRQARAALAASGTVTLELALAGVPSVVAYKVEPWAAPIMARLLTVDTVVLANLVLGERAMPELLQNEVTAERLADALEPLLAGGPAREAQLATLDRTEAALALPGGAPSDAAARAVLDAYRAKTGRGLEAISAAR
jgi:lipid-A-disaccharide synthase